MGVGCVRGCRLQMFVNSTNLSWLVHSRHYHPNYFIYLYYLSAKIEELFSMRPGVI
jgi:hypothetical protein